MREKDKRKISKAVRRLQNGDIDAFEEIYKLTVGFARFAALKIVNNITDVEDIIQESYIKVYENINEFDNPDKFLNWLNTIVMNVAKDFLKRKTYELYDDYSFEDIFGNLVSYEHGIEEQYAGFLPELNTESVELKHKVIELVDNLSDNKRTVVILFYFNGMKIKEIAESLEINENTVKSRLLQAKKDLANGIKKLEKNGFKIMGIFTVPLVVWALKRLYAETTSVFIESGAMAESFSALSAKIPSLMKSETETIPKTGVVSEMQHSAKSHIEDTPVKTVEASAANLAEGGMQTVDAVSKTASSAIVKRAVAGVVTIAVMTGTVVRVTALVKNKNERHIDNITVRSEGVSEPANENSDDFCFDKPDVSEKGKDEHERNKNQFVSLKTTRLENTTQRHIKTSTDKNDEGDNVPSSTRRNRHTTVKHTIIYDDETDLTYNDEADTDVIVTDDSTAERPVTDTDVQVIESSKTEIVTIETTTEPQKAKLTLIIYDPVYEKEARRVVIDVDEDTVLSAGIDGYIFDQLRANGETSDGTLSGDIGKTVKGGENYEIIFRPDE